MIVAEIYSHRVENSKVLEPDFCFEKSDLQITGMTKTIVVNQDTFDLIFEEIMESRFTQICEPENMYILYFASQFETAYNDDKKDSFRLIGFSIKGENEYNYEIPFITI